MYSPTVTMMFMATSLQILSKSQTHTHTQRQTDELLPFFLTLFFSISSLTTDQGLHLMELLCRKAKIQMTDFLELS